MFISVFRRLLMRFYWILSNSFIDIYVLALFYFKWMYILVWRIRFLLWKIFRSLSALKILYHPPIMLFMNEPKCQKYKLFITLLICSTHSCINIWWKVKIVKGSFEMFNNEIFIRILALKWSTYDCGTYGFTGRQPVRSMPFLCIF